MSKVKTLLSLYPHNLVKPFINPNKFVKNHPFHNFYSFFFTTHVSNSPFYASKPQKSTKNGNFGSKNKRPLDVIFKESLGLCKKEETLGNFDEEKGKNGEIMKKLWDLEIEIRELKLKSPSIEEKVGNLMGVMGKNGENGAFSKAKPKNLVALFGREVEEEKEVVFKEICEDMKMLLMHLYDCGYFKDVNFLSGNRFDMSCFYEEYAREYVKFALQRFGNDNKDISMWISGSDSKSIALFGCPTVTKGDVFAAKKLRSFFKIKEETVCRKCVLKESCKYANQSSGEGYDTSLRLDSLLRLVRAYSLEEISPRLKLTNDMKACLVDLSTAKSTDSYSVS
ncbi:hypothetical protein RND81_09G008100 [Saponaria officinalis]|uniref:Uncharacterized protein n=1 Tax=Saponaria officinalis TaxID=3572 RepID=A0AAW1IHB0_SAPOF